MLLRVALETTPSTNVAFLALKHSSTVLGTFMGVKCAGFLLEPRFAAFPAAWSDSLRLIRAFSNASCCRTAGVVALWDVSTGQQLAEYEAHEKRIWTVDFCHTDPMHFVSGSDDGWVKVRLLRTDASLHKAYSSRKHAIQRPCHRETTGIAGQ